MCYILHGDSMYIALNKKKILIIESKTFFSKLKGLMFKKNINYGIRLRTNGIHTFFMKEEIDVILTDKNNIVLKTYSNLKKNRIILPQKNVYYIYELPKDSIKNLNIRKVKIESK